TSGSPLDLSPAATPAARKPWGAVVVTWHPLVRKKSWRGILWCGRSHGATPTSGRPVVSGRPRARLAHWIAATPVPLVRLPTDAAAPAAWDRFWIISGVCRCTPPTPYALAEPMTSLPIRWGFADLPAPEVPLAATTTTSGSTSPAVSAGASASVTEVG